MSVQQACTTCSGDNQPLPVVLFDNDDDNIYDDDDNTFILNIFPTSFLYSRVSGNVVTRLLSHNWTIIFRPTPAQPESVSPHARLACAPVWCTNIYQRIDRIGDKGPTRPCGSERPRFHQLNEGCFEYPLPLKVGVYPPCFKNRPTTRIEALIAVQI